MKAPSPSKCSSSEQARLDPAGRVVLPARFRKSLKLEPGDPVTITLDRDTLRISSAQAALAKAQAIMRKRNPRKRSAVAALIKERRTEAAADR
jgi:AbrB family looped-hinge helix DNA binding protein